MCGTAQRSAATGLGGALAASLALLVAAPSPVQLAARVVHPTRSGLAVDPTAPLVAVLALLAWLTAVYLLLVAMVAVGSQVPGVVGAACRALLRRVAPATLRRAVELALGIGLTVGSVAGLAGPAAAQEQPAAAARPLAAVLDHPLASPPASPGPSLDHPLDDTLVIAGPAGEPKRAAGSAVPPPIVAPPATDPVAPRPEVAPPSAVVQPADVQPVDVQPAVVQPVDVQPVVVQPGDTLWGIARDHLPDAATDAQVALAWPTWWQANRQVVGDDPDLIRPGMSLLPPTAP